MHRPKAPKYSIFFPLLFGLVIYFFVGANRYRQGARGIDEVMITAFELTISQ